MLKKKKDEDRKPIEQDLRERERESSAGTLGHLRVDADRDLSQGWGCSLAAKGSDVAPASNSGNCRAPEKIPRAGERQESLQ
eukprot:1316149-Amphidinium_carterae.1